jgi:hypothetical protein
LHPLVREHALQQREQPLPVFAVGQQRRQRLYRLFRFVAGDDFLLAADAARLIRRDIRQQFPVLLDQLTGKLQPRKRERLVLWAKKATRASASA